MTRAHPWMASSTPEARQEMLTAIGANSVEGLFSQIPEDHRFDGPFGLPLHSSRRRRRCRGTSTT